MVVVRVCVGSSCHLKGAPEIVGLLEKKVEENGLGDEIALVGSFCAGKCNRVGVTVTVGENVYPGVTVDSFGEFWNDKVMTAVAADKGE